MSLSYMCRQWTQLLGPSFSVASCPKKRGPGYKVTVLLVGATCDGDSRKKFNTFLRGEMSKGNVKYTGDIPWGMHEC